MEPRLSIITLGVESLARAYAFYHEGLGLPTSGSPEQGIVFFKTSGACLALYPTEKLCEDIGLDYSEVRPSYTGVTIAHNTREKDEVDQLLQRAAHAGGTILKPAQDTFWGGYGGYFSDPDGHLWEIAWSKDWKFHADGSLVIE